MEMEPIQLDQKGNSIDQLPFEQLTPLVSYETIGVCGDPQVNPRVGDDYQVEIPSMISESEYLNLLMDPFDSEGMVDLSHSFLIGLPIQIMWGVCDKENKRKDGRNKCKSKRRADDLIDKNGSTKSRKHRRSCIMKKKDSKFNAKSLDDGKEFKPANLVTKGAGKSNVGQLHQSKNYCPLPGSSNDPWSDIEVDSFILGLFIFGKKFVQVKGFMGNKEMGDILSFYYGKFYKSDGHRRWSESRKTRRRKCVYGQKIFTGWRQQELLSRLHPHVPEHFHHAILEVSNAFTEGKVSLEDYVLNLKAIVGIQVLVQVIGIGKGKEDLTRLNIEPVKGNPLFPVCPIGKACSTLTSSDIIKLLTGGLRLSKARCNDIFWEAVWPRLLAKGWHSEQPKNQGYVDSKHPFVFLSPGVKKFSRRKLAKGNHYFDSIADVLDKVASEPKLIELESEEGRDSSYNEADGCIQEVQSNQDDPSVKSHHYLKPRVSTCNPNLVKLTIVDSSLDGGGKLSKVRQIRYSPDDLNVTNFHTTLLSRDERIFFNNSVEKKKLDVCKQPDGERNITAADNDEDVLNDCVSNGTIFTVVDTSLLHGGKSSMVRELRYSADERKVTSETTNLLIEGNSSEKSRNEHKLDVDDMLSNGEKNSVQKPNQCGNIVDTQDSNIKVLNSSITKKLMESFQDPNQASNRNQSTRTIKHQFSRRSKSGHSDKLVHLMKRRRLTACSKTETNHAIEKCGVGSKQAGPCCALDSPEAAGSNAFEVRPDHEKISSRSPSNEGHSEEGVIANCFGIKASNVEYTENQSPSSIDLNLPPVTFDSEKGEPVLMEEENSRGINASNTCFSSNSDKIDEGAPSASLDVNPEEKQPDMNPRRQSTRNRPLTTRALESLQCEFLNAKKKQKSTRPPAKETAFSSPRKARSKVKGTPSCVRFGSSTAEAEKKWNACKSFEMKIGLLSEESG